MVLIVASFEGDDEKAQYANFKHISFNACLGLTFFTKSLIVFIVMTTKFSGGVFPYICLIQSATKLLRHCTQIG